MIIFVQPLILDNNNFPKRYLYALIINVNLMQITFDSFAR